jgi:hypothetical protein
MVAVFHVMPLGITKDGIGQPEQSSLDHRSVWGGSLNETRILHDLAMRTTSCGLAQGPVADVTLPEGLPYAQLLTLLDKTPERLAFTLREDEFLWITLGSLKPRCEPIQE